MICHLPNPSHIILWRCLNRLFMGIVRHIEMNWTQTKACWAILYIYYMYLSVELLSPNPLNRNLYWRLCALCQHAIGLSNSSNLLLQDNQWCTSKDHHYLRINCNMLNSIYCDQSPTHVYTREYLWAHCRHIMPVLNSVRNNMRIHQTKICWRYRVSCELVTTQ